MTNLPRLAGWPSAGAPEDDAAFWTEQRAHGTRHARLLLALSVAVCVAWYPTDAVFFAQLPDVREAFVSMRLSVAAIAAAALVLVVFVPFGRRHAVSLGLVAGAAIAFAADWSFAIAGPPDEPWFHFTYPLVLTPLVFALRPAPRVLVTLGYAACLYAGYFGSGRWSPGAPMAGAAASFLVFSVALSIAAGLLADGLRRREFFARLSAQKQAAALAELSASLEARVLARTEELRLAIEGLEAAREEERTRIARDLHDDFGQELAGLTYAVDLATMREERGEPVGSSLREIRRQMARLRTTTRAILEDLRPRVLDDLGLEAAAEWLVTRVRERSTLDCRLQVAISPDPLPAPLATAVFRLLQEALTNVVRHAGASRADIELTGGDGRVELSVRDDGAGFDAAGAHRGFGLLGMRERARALGGTVSVQSAPGRGTVIRVVLPCAAAAKEAA